MSDICFIVAGMDKRKHFMEECIDAFRKSRYSDCDIFCYWQGEKWRQVKGKEIFKDVIIDSMPRGVFTPRYELMKRYASGYDYCIIIDDDLFIQQETDYYATIRFMKQFPKVGCACITHTQRAVKNRVEIVNSGSEYFNVAGGLVLSKDAVQTVLEYFADKENDYTFDCIWLLLWVKGYDLAKDFRSWAKHVAARKVNGEWSGFNESRVSMSYVPIMPEYIDNVPVVFNHGRQEFEIPTISNINERGRLERRALRHD